MFFEIFIALLFTVYLAILVFLVARSFFRPSRQQRVRRKIPMDDYEGEDVIEVLNLEKSFDHPVLSSISLKVKKGETVGVLGQSGTGKSVLLKLIAGFLKPDHGWIFFKGRDVASMTESELLEVRKRVSYVFQHGAVFDFLDVGENIAYPLREQGVTDEEVIRKRVEYLLDVVELEGMGKQPER